jgi:tryptophan-rich sensory protein
VFATPPSVTFVRNVVFATIAVTLVHFTDNFVSIDTYPAPSWQPDWFEWVVLASWPIFTLIGIAAYRAYRDGDFAKAHIALLAYSYTGLVSLGHFTSGSPDEFTTRGLISIAIDVVAGTIVLLTALRSIIARRNGAALSA